MFIRHGHTLSNVIAFVINCFQTNHYIDRVYPTEAEIEALLTHVFASSDDKRNLSLIMKTLHPESTANHRDNYVTLSIILFTQGDKMIAPLATILSAPYLSNHDADSPPPTMEEFIYETVIAALEKYPMPKVVEKLMKSADHWKHGEWYSSRVFSDYILMSQVLTRRISAAWGLVRNLASDPNQMIVNRVAPILLTDERDYNGLTPEIKRHVLFASAFAVAVISATAPIHDDAPIPANKTSVIFEAICNHANYPEGDKKLYWKTIFPNDSNPYDVRSPVKKMVQAILPKGGTL